MPRVLISLLLFLIPLPLRADDPQPPLVVPSDPVFEALLLDGSTVSGRIAELSLGDPSRAVLIGDKTEEISLDKLVKITRRGDAPPYPPAGSLVLLPEGDRLRAIVNGTPEGIKLDVLPNALGDLVTSIPLDRVLGLVLAPPSDPNELEALVRKIREDTRDSEVLWMANGDRLTGSLQALDAQTVTFDSGNGPLPFQRSAIVALGFDPALLSYPKPKGPYLELTFADGSRLGVVSSRVEQGHVVAETRFGGTIRVPFKELSRVHVLGGPVSYLSSRKPAGSQFVPYLDRHPNSFGVDSTWDGHHLRLSGQPYDRGLGMLPRTLAAYRLEPGDRRFQATVGLDDRAGEKASVIFRVLADKTEIFHSGVLTRQDAPVSVDVDVQGANLLILIVEFGDRGDVQDSADWVESRLIH